MALISISNASLAYGHHALLDHAELIIDAGDRVGLIGRNGGGKSTLLKVLVGEAMLDDGLVWRSPGLKAGYVPQEPQLDEAATVFEAVSDGLGILRDTLREYHAVGHQLETQTDLHDALLHQLQALQEKLESSGGWTTHHRVETVLSQLGLPSDRPVGELSGGWKKRVALARALVADPDLLVLDEPTNHLDIASIEWLENLLRSFRGSLVFVTHDRQFLDRVATRIVELDRGRLAEFGSSFQEYQRRKTDQLNAEAVADAKFDKVLAQEEVWIRKGIEARRTRNEGRVRRLETLRRERAVRRDRVGHVHMAVDAGERSGELVVDLNDVTIRFEDKVIASHFSTRILRGDKVGVIGPNGAGKTTLLRVILGELPPSSGKVKLGSRLSFAYFDQLRAQLDPEATLAETISPGSDFVEINGVRKHVVSYLGDFLFPPERVRAKVKSLSGGERNRLLLARLFTRPANVLVLDEPTNDLDIETLDLLESLLADYQGTLFLVSHDRAFLDNVVTQVIVLDGEGGVTENAGGYSDWVRYLSSRGKDATASSVAKPESKPSAPTPPRDAGRNAQRPEKLSFKETRELEALPSRIEALEAEQGALTAKLADPATYKGSPDIVRDLQSRNAAIEQELVEAMSRWEALEQKLARSRG
jgi:ATP-binding cassette subfamily F protein uup